MYEFNTLVKDIKFPKLKTFRWKGNSLVTKEEQLTLKEREEEQDLTEFSLNTPLLTTFDIQNGVNTKLTFSKAIKNWTNLKSLKSVAKIRNYFASKEVIDSAATDINCGNLEELFLVYSPKITVGCFIKLKNLKRLTICEQNIDDKFVEIISLELPLLEYIDLSKNPVTNNGIITLVKNCKNLKTIRAFKCQLSPASLPNEIKDIIVY